MLLWLFQLAVVLWMNSQLEQKLDLEHVRASHIHMVLGFMLLLVAITITYFFYGITIQETTVGYLQLITIPIYSKKLCAPVEKLFRNQAGRNMTLDSPAALWVAQSGHQTHKLKP